MFFAKNLTTNLSDTQEMLKVVESEGLKHMICFNYSKVPALALAKRMV